MKKNLKKWLCIALAVVLVFSALPLLAGALVPSGAGTASVATANTATANGQAPLKVEISSNKEKYNKIDTAVFTVKITNTSNKRVNNVSTQVLFNDLAPLGKNTTSVNVKSLVPNQSTEFSYKATISPDNVSLNWVQKLVLIFVRLFSISFSMGENNFNDGRAFFDTNQTVKFAGTSIANTVRVWYGDIEEFSGYVWQDTLDMIDKLDKDVKSIVDSSTKANVAKKLKDYVDNEVKNNNIKKYSYNHSCLEITLNTGVPYLISWAGVYARVNSRQEIDITSFLATATALSTTNSSIIQETNKFNIMTLQPYYFAKESNTPVFDNAAQKIENATDNYVFSTNLDNIDVTIETMKRLADYKVLILNSHGMIREENGQYAFALSIPRSSILNEKYETEMIAEPYKIIYAFAEGGETYAVTAEFFYEHYADTYFDNALLYLGTCHSAEDRQLIDFFIQHGIKTILAYENSVFRKYDIDMCETIFDELVKKDSNSEFNTVKQAVTTAKNKHGEDDSYPGDRFTAMLSDVFPFEYQHYNSAKLEIFGHDDWSLDKEYLSEQFTTTPMIAAGYGHTVALKSDGTVWAWGDNSVGQFGNGTTTSSVSPVKSNVDNVIAISAVGKHTIALKSDGTAWAWGENNFGQLGDGTTIDRHSPVRVGKSNDWERVSAGENYTVAIKTDGSLWAWGWNYVGQLGDSTETDKLSPIRIGKDNDWVSITAGYGHTVAIKTNGSLWAWGGYFASYPGDDTSVRKRFPVRIGTDNDWKFVSTGRAIKTDGSLWAWGNNMFGQLGNGTTLTRYFPVGIGTDNDWSSVTVGFRSTIAIKTDGSLWAWGWNEYGQLGDGTKIDRHSPVRIGEDNDWECVSAGQNHTVAIKIDGGFWAWGSNGHGQLGDGTTIDHATPVQVLGENGVGYFNVN